MPIICWNLPYVLSQFEASFSGVARFLRGDSQLKFIQIILADINTIYSNLYLTQGHLFIGCHMYISLYNLEIQRFFAVRSEDHCLQSRRFLLSET